MLHRLRQLAALATSIALLAGTPYLLINVMSWPNLDLSWTTIQVYAHSGRLPPGIPTALLITALWVVWGTYLLAAALEVLAWLRGGPPRTRPLGPLQLVAATALGATLATPAAHAAAPPTSAAPVQETSSDGGTAVSERNEAQTGGDIARNRTLSGFGYDDATLTQRMETDLVPTINLIAEHGTTDEPVVVTGHTDTAGDATYNQELSHRRGEAVASHLRSQLGENAPTIQTRGKGEEDPLPDSDAASQRRVDISYAITPAPPPSADEDTSAAPPPEPELGSTDPGDEEQQAVVLLLPSGAALSLTTAAAAASGAVGGYALAARRRLRSQAPSRQNEPSAASATGPPARTDELPHNPQTPEVSEPADEDPLRFDGQLALELTRSPGLGVTGPGAHGSARALIAAALQHTAPASAEVHVLLCNQDVPMLLGEEARTLLTQVQVPTIEVLDSLPAAMNLLHTYSVERQHQLREAGVDTVAELRSSGRVGTLPPVVLVATPHPDHEEDLAALLLATTDLDITALLLESWPPGETLTLEDRGTITDTTPPRPHLHGARWPTCAVPDLTHLLYDQSTVASPASSEYEPTPEHTTTAGEEERKPHTAKAAERAEQKTTQPPVRLQLLGRVRITVDGTRVDVRRNSAYEVAAYLAVHPDGIRRDHAIEDMWPQQDPRRVTHRFHDAVSSLRHLLRPSQGQDAPTIITRVGDTYVLEPTLVEVDLWEFTAALEAAENADHQEQRHTHVQSALALYTGDLAAQADYPWIEPTRIRLQQRLVRTLRHHATQLAGAHPHEAVSILQRAVELDPTNEDTHQELIRHHLTRGENHEAHAAYQRCVEELRRIDTDPSPHVSELVAEAKRSN